MWYKATGRGWTRTGKGAGRGRGGVDLWGDGGDFPVYIKSSGATASVWYLPSSWLRRRFRLRANEWLRKLLGAPEGNNDDVFRTGWREYRRDGGHQRQRGHNRFSHDRISHDRISHDRVWNDRIPH